MKLKINSNIITLIKYGNLWPSVCVYVCEREVLNSSLLSPLPPTWLNDQTLDFIFKIFILFIHFLGLLGWAENASTSYNTHTFTSDDVIAVLWLKLIHCCAIETWVKI